MVHPFIPPLQSRGVVRALQSDEITKAAGVGNTGALHTTLFGLGFQLPGTPAPLALGAHNHLAEFLGLGAFPGSHLGPLGVVGAGEALAQELRRLEKLLGVQKANQNQAGTPRHPLGLGEVHFANFPPNRLPGSELASSSGPASHARPRPSGMDGARSENWEAGCEGAPPAPWRAWRLEVFLLFLLFWSPGTLGQQHLR